MEIDDILSDYKHETLVLTEGLRKEEIFEWIVNHGYFPEQYVLPPCFNVSKTRGLNLGRFYNPIKNGKEYKPKRTTCVNISFPKTDLTDRVLSIIHPKIHFDIAHIISDNWNEILESLIPADSNIVSYSFPIPLSKHCNGRVGSLRGGRMAYEFLEMTDDHLISIAYKHKYIVNADIKNFYPSIYTHSIAWALHTKETVRNIDHNSRFTLTGNLLDKLFQNASDGRTNGIPVGPVVSDIISEIIACAVDIKLTKYLNDEGIIFDATRFKDDYRFLVQDEYSAKRCIKLLHKALQEYNLQINDEKTHIAALPEGLFREWVSKYHLANPNYKHSYSWKEFRELYLAVVNIDKVHPNTGVIDRFLSDITTDSGDLKIELGSNNIEKVLSMLLMMGNLKIKAFPKIIAIIENVFNNFMGEIYARPIVDHLEKYLEVLLKDKEKNSFLIMWIYYFFKSNNIGVISIAEFKDDHPAIQSIAQDICLLFEDQEEFILFEDCVSSKKRTTLYEHLNIFDRNIKEEDVEPQHLNFDDEQPF